MRTARFSKASDDAHLLIGYADGQKYRRQNPTEEYVCIPPAFIITDVDGATWTLGRSHNGPPHFEFMVMRDDLPMGIYASKIERRRGRIVAYGSAYRKAIFSHNMRNWF